MKLVTIDLTGCRNRHTCLTDAPVVEFAKSSVLKGTHQKAENGG